MSWTRIGTINVTNNSTSITGVGTQWLTEGLTRAGDMLLIGTSEYEVAATPTTNTSLTLVTPYTGTTATGLSYAIVHTGLLPSELARDLSILQQKYLASMSLIYDNAIVGPGTWRQGTTVPSNSLGVDGDRYVNTLTGLIYLKQSGAYVNIGSVAGPAGPQGPTGPQGLTGPQGPAGVSSAESSVILSIIFGS